MSVSLRRVLPVLALLATLSSAVSTWRAVVAAAPGNVPDTRDWIQLFNGKDLTGWTPKFARHDARREFQRHVPRRERPARGALRQVDGVRRRVRPPVLQGAVLALHHRRRVPVRRRAGDGRARLGDAGNNGLMVHSPAPEDHAEGPGLPDLARGAAARRARGRASRARRPISARRARTS